MNHKQLDYSEKNENTKKAFHFSEMPFYVLIMC